MLEPCRIRIQMGERHKQTSLRANRSTDPHHLKKHQRRLAEPPPPPTINMGTDDQSASVPEQPLRRRLRPRPHR
ncbi:hypothetical protein C0J52_13977 [Blattella germanica]|nr:hypothetical protein C0J52_13977 [Blattella germanica]